MGLLFAADFETGDTSQFTSNSGTVQTTVIRNGSYSGQNTDNQNFIKVLSSEHGTIYSSGWYRWGTEFVAGNQDIIMFANSTNTNQFDFRVTGGTLLTMLFPGAAPDYNGTLTNPLQKDTWYQFEIKYVSHDTAGSIEVRVNGTTYITQGNIDTIAGTDSGIREMRWQGINFRSGTVYVDDVALRDDDWISKADGQSIKVSRANNDALTSVHPNAFIFHSNFNTFKIVSTGTVAVSYGTNGGTETVAHNQSAIPSAYAFFKFASGYVSLPDQGDRGTSGGGGNLNQWNLQVDGTNLYFVFPNADQPSYNGTIRYYIFEAPGS